MSMIRYPGKGRPMFSGAGMISARNPKPMPSISGNLASDLTVAGLETATFTRSTTAVFTDYEGVLRTAAVNEPRFEGGRRISEGVWSNLKPDGSPIYPAPKLLMEGQGQNLCLWSGDLSNASWVKESTTPPVITVDNRMSPAGVVDADMVTAVVGGNLLQDINTGASIAGKTFTLSFWVYTENAISLTLRIRGVGTVTEAENKIIGIPSNAWTKCVFTKSFVSADGNTVKIAPALNMVTGWVLWIWGVQLEQSPVPTSYIPTGASPVTRTADACSWPLSAELQAMFAAEGTLVLDWTPGFIPPVAQIGIVSCAAAVDSLLSVAAGGSVTRSTDGTTPITGGATLVKNTQRKLILRWSAASGKYQLSSIASGVITHGTEGNFDGAFTLGSNLLLHYSNAYPAKYSALKLFKRYLTDSELMRLQ